MPKARLYVEANEKTKELIQARVKKYDIDCQLEVKDAYLYTKEESGVKKFKQEVDAYKQLGIDREWKTALPFDASIKAALAMTHHLLHYEGLERFGDATFGIEEVLYRWSTHDIVTMDQIPYIGRLTKHHQNIFVATGFRKWA